MIRAFRSISGCGFLYVHYAEAGVKWNRLFLVVDLLFWIIIFIFIVSRLVNWLFGTDGDTALIGWRKNSRHLRHWPVVNWTAPSDPGLPYLATLRERHRYVAHRLVVSTLSLSYLPASRIDKEREQCTRVSSQLVHESLSPSPIQRSRRRVYRRGLSSPRT